MKLMHPSNPRRAIKISAALIAVSVIGLVASILAASVPIAACNIVLVGVWSTALIFAIEEQRYGHREAAGDRDDPYTFGTSFSAFTAAALAPGGAAEGTDPGLTESFAEVPILAFKAADLTWAPHKGPAFTALTRGVTYGVEADATCVRVPAFLTVTFASMYSALGSPAALPSPTHAAPDAGCGCGFYAHDRADAIVGGSVLLDVELSGRVVVHEYGYRAAHQRVIRARLRGCYYCGAKPDHVELIDSSAQGGRVVQVRCAAHASAGSAYLTIEQLGDRLGIPIDLMERAA